MGEGTNMRKNNARSLKLPSASWIRNVIKEEVKAQLAERESERTSPRHDFWDGPERPTRSERRDAPMSGSDDWNEWWDGPRPSDREERSARPEPRGRHFEDNRTSEKERSVWNFWDGDYMSDPIMEQPKRRTRSQDWESSVERELEASISPVDQPRRKKVSKNLRGKR